MKSFAVIVPSFNNARWCRDNLDSVLSQNHLEFRVIYIDDASTDDTENIVADYLRESPEAHRVKFIRNETRVGPLANSDRAIRSCDPNEIVVLVDGDDFLDHPQVLTRLDTIYQDPDVWLTWGQFARHPPDLQEGFCAPIPQDVVSANAFRDFTFVSSHLRTFYAGLYQRIRPLDLQDGEEQFYKIAGDVAQMFALQEMAGPHGRFVAEILYKYNRANPLNDDKLDRRRQIRTENEIRAKPRYGRVSKPIGPGAPREVGITSGPERNLFGTPGPIAGDEQRHRPFRQMRSVLNRLGYTVRETETFTDLENPEAILVFDVRPEELQLLRRFPREILTLVLWKDPASAPSNFQAEYHEAFQRIYTWCDDLVDNVRYFKFHLPSLRPMISKLVPFEQRKLCTLIATYRESDHPDQLYSEERRLTQFVAAEGADYFDLFGVGWGLSARDYLSVAPSRVGSLSRYRFSYCYETVRNWKGFITSKIFDSFAAGCVPIYWGAPDIASAIPADCFIAREAFASDRELFEFLKQMPVEVHEAYLQRIRTFLSSERAIPFSAEHFARTFVRLIRGRNASRTADPMSIKLAPASLQTPIGSSEDLRGPG